MVLRIDTVEEHAHTALLVVDVRRTVHVAYQMDHVAQVDHDGRIVEITVIPQPFDRTVQFTQHIGFEWVAGGILRGFALAVIHVPPVGHLVTGFGTVVVHPRRVVDDRMAQIPFDHGFRTLGQMRLGDVGHGVVARLAPRQRTLHEAERRKREQQRFFHNGVLHSYRLSFFTPPGGAGRTKIRKNRMQKQLRQR